MLNTGKHIAQLEYPYLMTIKGKTKICKIEDFQLQGGETKLVLSHPNIAYQNHRESQLLDGTLRGTRDVYQTVTTVISSVII